MNNVIELESYRKSLGGYRVLQRENDDSKLVEALYLYDDDGEGIYGTYKLLEGFEFISIQSVQEEIQEQREAIRTGIDKYGNEIDYDEIEPWGDGGVIVCKEGVFVWDWETEQYRWIGEVDRTVRKRVVHVLKDSVVKMGATYKPLKRGNSYLLDGEYVAYDDKMNPVVMIVINPIGCVPMAVPFDQETLLITERDFAVIEYID